MFLSLGIAIALNVVNGKKLVFFFTHFKKSPVVSTINSLSFSGQHTQKAMFFTGFTFDVRSPLPSLLSI